MIKICTLISLAKDSFRRIFQCQNKVSRNPQVNASLFFFISALCRTPPRLNKRTLSHINQGRVQKSHKLPAHVGIWSDPTNSFWTTETKSHNTPSFNQQLERAKQMDD